MKNTLQSDRGQRETHTINTQGNGIQVYTIRKEKANHTWQENTQGKVKLQESQGNTEFQNKTGNDEIMNRNQTEQT